MATTNGKDANVGTIWPDRDCPVCHSDDTYVYSTKRPTRYVRCRDCDHCFKAVEKKKRKVRLVTRCW